MSPQELEERLERLLPRVQRPARYVGGELNQVVKRWDEVAIKVGLAFPDIYDIGMPNTGLAILYDIINAQQDMLAERIYLPWTDMEQLMREHEIPLYALESKHAVCDFDLLGISLPYDTVYTNLLSLLDLAGIPLDVGERDQHPVVLVGGHATFNPEPVHRFIDAVCIGEGEEAILEVARCVGRWRREQSPQGEGMSRQALHRELAQIEGIYVPSLYQAHYLPDGRLERLESLADEAPLPIKKRVVPQLTSRVSGLLVPNLETVHDRATVEIQRGCTRGCRFCHAGMVTRPVRERPVEQILENIGKALDRTGFSEVGLLSLSSSDYSSVLELIKEISARYGDRRLNVSLPSLRIESFSVDLMQALQGASRRGGFTLAPEAASERMREIINKPVSTAQVVETAREVFSRGWHTIKLYFMIGHPHETLEDVEAIIELCEAVLRAGKQEIGGRAKVHVGVSTFVPKPHTPFQWVPCDTREQIAAKQQLLRRGLRNRRFKLSWSNPEETMHEAWLSRGDRRLANVIEHAWRNGARFDAWQEHFKPEIWQQAFEAHGLSADFYTHRQRDLDEVLPWDHIDIAIDKRFLVEDYRMSEQRKTRVDCREKCFGCGLLSRYVSIQPKEEGSWKCPVTRPVRQRVDAPSESRAL
jgi:radical SAM family uncharacterized protein